MEVDRVDCVLVRAGVDCCILSALGDLDRSGSGDFRVADDRVCDVVEQGENAGSLKLKGKAARLVDLRNWRRPFPQLMGYVRPPLCRPAASDGPRRVRPRRHPQPADLEGHLHRVGRHRRPRLALRQPGLVGWPGPSAAKTA